MTVVSYLVAGGTGRTAGRCARPPRSVEVLDPGYSAARRWTGNLTAVTKLPAPEPLKGGGFYAPRVPGAPRHMCAPLARELTGGTRNYSHFAKRVLAVPKAPDGVAPSTL